MTVNDLKEESGRDMEKHVYLVMKKTYGRDRISKEMICASPTIDSAKNVIDSEANDALNQAEGNHDDELDIETYSEGECYSAEVIRSDSKNGSSTRYSFLKFYMEPIVFREK